MVRIKHRYLLVNILYPDPKSPNVRLVPKDGDEVPHSVQFRRPSSDLLSAKTLIRLIRDGIEELFGDYGSGKIVGSLQVKYFSPATSTAIIRVARDHYRLVWAALTFTTRLPKPEDYACVIQVVRVSGTIKKAEEEAIRRARIAIIRAQNAGSNLSIVPLSMERTRSTKANDEDDDWTMENGIEDSDEPGDVYHVSDDG